MFFSRLEQYVHFIAQCCQRSDNSEAEKALEAICNADATKLRLKKDFSVAKWDPASGMAKVVVRKGKMLNTTGISRDDTYCHVEEAVFLVEHGFLVLMLDDEPLGLQQAYELLSSNEYGCSWDAYQVYSYFKALGYVLGRHGVYWSRKQQHHDEQNRRHVQGQLLKLTFDVYPPNNRFKKTSPGSPCFSICVVSGQPPSSEEVRRLQEQNGGTLVRFATVDGGHVGIFSFSQVELPILP